MSKLEELLQGVDVERKTLKEYVKLEKGKQLNKEFLSLEGKYPAYNGGITYSGFTDNYNYDENKIIISQGGASAGFVNFITTKFYANAHCYVVLPNIELVNNKYIYYLLKYKQENLTNKQHGAGIPALKTSEILKLQVPIPCPDNPEKSLEIQQEIVRVLDELTSLTNQLTTELETERQNRKKQFEFFREQLFRFEEGSIIFNKLGEIGEFQRGKRFVKTDMISEGVPCIHYGEMYTHYGIWANKTKSFLSKELVDSKKLRLAKKNDVIMVAAGETIEDIGKGTSWLSEQGVVFHDACFSYTSPLNPSYVAYFTRTKQFHDQIRRNISSGKISAINSKGLEKVYIPIPSIEKQERIVTLLDQFDATHTAIEEEITKEIKLRTQQYEYYREKLLSFPSLRTT